MKKLFAFGCSLTYPFGWKDIVAEKANLRLVNSAMYAGSNGLQLRRLQSYIANNQIDKDDIIVWQITCQTRSCFSINPSEDWNQKLAIEKTDQNWPGPFQYCLEAPPNFFDGHKHLDVLSIHPAAEEFPEYYDSAQSLEALISTMILLNNTYKILVFVGWPGALDDGGHQENYSRFIRTLANNNIPHMSESYLEWVLKHDLAMDPNDPSQLHPSMEASEAYGEQVVYTKIKELRWI